jgi:signal transduction histidine kinase
MATILGGVCALDRLVLGPHGVTWFSYALPVLIAPRLVPLPVVPLVLLITVLLGGSNTLSHGTAAAGAVGGDELLKALMLVAVGLYAVRDVQREHELEEAKAQLLRLVSHELRTPLHHIKGFASTLLQPDLEWDAATQRECLEAIEQGADRLARLIEALLDMARIADGCFQPRRQPCAPAALVTAAVQIARDAHAEHPLQVAVPRTLSEVLVDPIQVERVLVNLLSNAAKYSPAGSPIEVRATEEGGAVVIRIADEGAGVAKTERRRIFQRFQRGSSAGVTRAPGTGLGLAIAQELVVAQDGKIWVEQNVPRGSIFAVRLPLAAGRDVSRGRGRAQATAQAKAASSLRAGETAAAAKQ